MDALFTRSSPAIPLNSSERTGTYELFHFGTQITLFCPCFVNTNTHTHTHPCAHAQIQTLLITINSSFAVMSFWWRTKYRWRAGSKEMEKSLYCTRSDDNIRGKYEQKITLHVGQWLWELSMPTWHRLEHLGSLKKNMELDPYWIKQCHCFNWAFFLRDNPWPSIKTLSGFSVGFI